ncbi:RluA family pseudouridine synthase [Fusibacter sp. 3D3]|uniref:RluA family pseudouridine synthase n=1 Tax=Fusibacter sp. 3D3 TaxID=1048380 RepID=UPI000853E304|nr:RluA family pseudouridine synthase [Fusibacter sp. 3D3]GAU77374.1 ribosomal large subunit pseudouridine synthase D [Fusibacter sp. 3D3]
MFINDETLKLEYQVEAKENGLKVIDVVATCMNISSRLIRKCKSNHNILLNRKKTSVNQIVNAGDVITLMLDHDENTFEANPIEINIVFESADMMAINKPPFLVVHPTKGHPEGTLANAISYYQYKSNQNFKTRFINRLDRDTSGIVLIAKNAYAQQFISEQMQNDAVDKIYYAVVEGVLTSDRGTINEPIERAEEGDILRIVRPDGLPSITHYEVIERFKGFSLLRVKLETGRTHQIRVHLAHIGHGIVGDHLYGNVSDLIERQALHCFEMAFKKPRGSEWIVVNAPLPEDITELIESLRIL